MIILVPLSSSDNSSLSQNDTFKEHTSTVVHVAVIVVDRVVDQRLFRNLVLICQTRVDVRGKQFYVTVTVRATLFVVLQNE